MTTIDDRKARRMDMSGVTKRASLMGAAAVTAAAMTMGTVASNAYADPIMTINADVTTTGPLLWLAAQLGLDNIPYTYTIEGIGDVLLNIDLDWTESDPVGLYDAINAAPFINHLTGGATRPGELTDYLFGTTDTMAPLLLATGTGTTGAIDAFRAMYASASGHTPDGFTPLTPKTGAGSNVTNLPMILIRNLGTPNGGFNTRFAEIWNLFGVDPTSPEGASTSSPKIGFNSMVANLGIAYDSFSDFPITANIFSIANSLMAGALPTNLLSGIELKGDSEETIVGNLLGVLGGSSSTSYTYIVPTDFALLEPLRLPARLINLALEQLGVDFRMPTLLADALTPITKILVNIGYTDVVTPEMIANDPETYGDYQPYDRTFLEAAGSDGQAVNWLSENPLTPSEWRDVPRDLVQALIDGFLGPFIGGGTSTAAPAAALAPAAAATAPVAADDAAPASNEQPSGGISDEAASSTSVSTDAPASVTGSKNKSRTGSAAPKASAGDKSNGGSPSRGLGGSKRAAQAASSSDAA